MINNYFGKESTFYRLNERFVSNIAGDIIFSTRSDRQLQTINISQASLPKHAKHRTFPRSKKKITKCQWRAIETLINNYELELKKVFCKRPPNASQNTYLYDKTVIRPIIIHQTHYEKSDWSRAFNQFTIACELDMINAISAADIAFIMSSSTSAWLLSPMELSAQKQNG